MISKVHSCVRALCICRNWLAIWTGQSVKHMRHFEGMVLQNVEKTITPKLMVAILKKYGGLR